MSNVLPVYLVGPADGRLASVAAALGSDAVPIAAAGAAEAAPALARHRPGVAVFDADGMRVGDLLEILTTLPTEGWTVAMVTGDDPPRMRTLSLGAPDPLEDVRHHVEDPTSTPGCLLDLDRALVEMSRVRHDVNNPLTAAMAEAQLLLMEEPAGEDRESLEAILQQLRRIRDMLAESRYLRPRKNAAP